MTEGVSMHFAGDIVALKHPPALGRLKNRKEYVTPKNIDMPKSPTCTDETTEHRRNHVMIWKRITNKLGHVLLLNLYSLEIDGRCEGMPL